MKRIAVITDQSIWLVEANDEFTTGHVASRASFGFHMPTDHAYSGPILVGDNGLNLRPGTRLVFQCSCQQRHDGWPGTGIVTSGVIRRIVNFDDLPHKGAPEGFLDITPSWEGIAFVDRYTAQQAGKQADRLVSLHDMGRITDDDIVAADVRTRERFS